VFVLDLSDAARVAESVPSDRFAVPQFAVRDLDRKRTRLPAQLPVDDRYHRQGGFGRVVRVIAIILAVPPTRCDDRPRAPVGIRDLEGAGFVPASCPLILPRACCCVAIGGVIALALPRPVAGRISSCNGRDVRVASTSPPGPCRCRPPARVASGWSRALAPMARAARIRLSMGCAMWGEHPHPRPLSRKREREI